MRYQTSLPSVTELRPDYFTLATSGSATNSLPHHGQNRNGFASYCQTYPELALCSVMGALTFSMPNFQYSQSQVITCLQASAACSAESCTRWNNPYSRSEEHTPEL